MNLVVVRHLRKFIPLEKQVGWEKYYLRNRHLMTVSDKATKKKIKEAAGKARLLGHRPFHTLVFHRFWNSPCGFFSKGPPEAAAFAFWFSFFGIIIMNVAIFYTCSAKKKKERQFIQEVERADYEPYAELTLPPELEE